ncbi:MAG: hypothetical protein IH621_09935, partial [Krumholzibacteria bacterium]|nr:hypothetical protein [Candidatus Krumholzibacteria bacterium]
MNRVARCILPILLLPILLLPILADGAAAAAPATRPVWVFFADRAQDGSALAAALA